MQIKKLTEAILRIDTTVNKIQFDKEWFYSVEDLEDYLKEDLEGIESVTFPLDFDGVKYPIKCTTWDDLQRFLEKDPVENFRTSVLKNRGKK
ncbi:hypothetical protein [Flavobacterium cerinum]|uniref:Uncharacterized protein n=1 Tax=Flavobacterium cerinum TaxID=2502784 RepID=A0A444HBL7_9FLAO|nr:hypothetical protein [Flavobacterium cerinum]RWX00864.1 hypothetical protein EPI11_07530 [Flavobacterium cerinum]